jgi:hypothetical protein
MNLTPNVTQIWSVIRALLLFGGGILVTKGYLTSDQLTTLVADIAEIVGPIAAIIAIVWGLMVHTKAATVKRAADIVPIPPLVQAQAGIDPNKAQTLPRSPKETP